jgi:hypothetical protein
MTQQLPNDELDTALILEGELRRRVREVAHTVVGEEVKRQMGVIFAEQKAKMMMEISINIGKMLNLIEKEDRKPLWESTPEEFGLTPRELNSHMISNNREAVPTLEEIKDALREQTPSV